MGLLRLVINKLKMINKMATRDGNIISLTITVTEQICTLKCN